MTHPRSWFRVSLLVLASLSLVTFAHATTIQVVPGPGTPVQDAIDAASPGDTIKLAGGGYPESIVITKPLRLRGVPGTYLDAMPSPGPAVIAPGCTGSTSGITVAADDVKIADLRVIGFTDYGIHIQGRDKVTVTRVMTLPNCLGDIPLAGVYVASSTRVTLDDDWIAASAAVAGTAAIHLSALPERANVKLKSTLGGDHAIGVLIDTCAPRSVQVSHCYANFNLDAGILLQNSDGIVVKGTQVQENDARGIAVDAGSDDNRLTGNDVGGSPTDVSDAGNGNCWKKNAYTTGSVPGCP